MTPPKDSRRFAPPALILVGLTAAISFALSFPAVEGLGTKVRLPVFHGALTWVNLMAFSALGLCALAYLFTSREGLYRWAEGVRWIAVPMWIAGSGLGLIAALQTWDFTGSKAAPFEVVAADPRLMAQAWIMLAGMLVLALGLLIDERRWLAAGDLAFVTLAWTILMRAVLGPGRALHPDSPVLNSDELIIKLMFFGIVGSRAGATGAAAWWVRRARVDSGAEHAV
jgi:hypothetical protein